MNRNSLKLTDIIPIPLRPASPEGLPFLMWRHRRNADQVLDQIATHIERIEAGVMTNIQSPLELQFHSMSRDSSGNVCFADDPHLRPEFRTGFHPIDLWDYYYALWHSNQKGEFFGHTDNDLPWPDSRVFWKRVSVGKKLRVLHSTRHLPEQSPLIISESGEVRIKTVPDRYRIAEESENTGRLYLNEQSYIDRVPQLAWEFSLRGYRPLQDYFKDHIGEILDADQTRSLCQWIEVVERTSRMVMK